MSDSLFPYKSAQCSEDRVYLQTEYLQAANSILQLDDEMVDAYGNALQTIRTDDKWRNIVHRFHMQLFSSRDEETIANAVLQLPEIDETDELRGMLIPVVLLSGLPYTVECYERRGIPATILIDTLSDLKLNLHHYRAEFGHPGTQNIRWLNMHFRGNLFRLGRLQFHIVSFPYNIYVFRQPETGEFVVFPGRGVAYRKDGKVDGTNRIFDAEWVSEFSLEDQSVTGHRISKDGEVHKQRISLSRTDWDMVCKPGDPVLKVHIPAEGKLTPESCRASYFRAVQFFANHFPEADVRGIFCYTWLLSPQLKSILPDDSNIVRFQQDFSLFPVLSNDTQTMQRVFGIDSFDPGLVPRNTRLQVLLFDYLSAGNRIHGGAGFMLKESWATKPDEQ